MSPSPSGSRSLTGTTAVAVTEASQVGEARRTAVLLAGRLGFDATASGKVALVVTEIATNLVKHAREGLILLRPLEQGSSLGVEVLALDRGPGIADLARCLRDGFSTAGSPGAGLGAIARQSASFDVYSGSGNGVALVACLWSGPPPPPPRFRCAAVSLPKSGEDVCGDAWAVAHEGERELMLIADGLGHGPQAAEAATAAVRAFQANSQRSLTEILQAAHGVLRMTRGAAVAVAEVDLDRRVVQFAGVGNIAGAILSSQGSRSMMSHNGTLGHEARTFQAFSYPFPKGATLVMHSDGLLGRWRIDPYPGLPSRDPALIAGVLYRDFQRGRDDVTVLAASERNGNGETGA